MKHLILGGARSGKSQFSEQLALDVAAKTHKKCMYIATGSAGDSEMQTRIQHHQNKRSDAWQLIEEPINVSNIINTYNNKNHIILIDCFTLWLSNCMHHNCFNTQKKALLQSLHSTQADIFMVSNEVGSGVVPLGQLSRDFVDNAGRLHQDIAKLCDHVTLVMAGLPLNLK